MTAKREGSSRISTRTPVTIIADMMATNATAGPPASHL